MCSGWSCYAGRSIVYLAGHHSSCLSSICQFDVKMFVVSAGWCAQLTNEQVLFFHKCSCFFSKKNLDPAIYERYKHLCLHLTACYRSFVNQKYVDSPNLRTTPRLTISLTAHTFQEVVAACAPPPSPHPLSHESISDVIICNMYICTYQRHPHPVPR